MAGCKNHTDSEDTDADLNVSAKSYEIYRDQLHDPLRDDIIVVRRQTQTVRAVEPRTGGERWNFSVGYHDLEMLKPSDCHTRAGASTTTLDLKLTINVPDGTVKAYSDNKQMWQYKVSAPDLLFFEIFVALMLSHFSLIIQL